ncbi:MAG: acyltransferase family protein [Planctomycetota bacterium]
MNSEQGPERNRLLSLDAMRGFDMFWIIGGGGLVSGLIAWSGVAWLEPLQSQFEHVEWEGLHAWDLIFPVFLFIAGVTLPLSIDGRLADGVSPTRVWLRCLRRAALLVLLGLVYNGLLRFEFDSLRFPSVLGLIGLAWLWAASIYLFLSLRSQLIAFALLLISYWLALLLIPVPGIGAGVWTPEGSLMAYVDRCLMSGHLFRPDWDPEGLLGTLPAAAIPLAGSFCARILLSPNFNSARRCLILLLVGLACLGLGELWGLAFPVIKQLWTSSFVLLAIGWGALLLVVFHLLVDVLGFRRWAIPFIWIGANPILIYIAAHVAVDFGHSARFLFGGLVSMASPALQPALHSLAVLLIELALLGYLYRRRIFIRV